MPTSNAYLKKYAKGGRLTTNYKLTHDLAKRARAHAIDSNLTDQEFFIICMTCVLSRLDYVKGLDKIGL